MMTTSGDRSRAAIKAFAREVCRNDLLNFGRLHFFFPDSRLALDLNTDKTLKARALQAEDTTELLLVTPNFEAVPPCSRLFKSHFCHSAVPCFERSEKRRLTSSLLVVPLAERPQ